MRRSLAVVLAISMFWFLSLYSCAIKGMIGYGLGQTDIYIFKNTEAWDLAVAVKNQDVRKIEKITETHPDWLNVQDPLYDVTLLMWAVGTERYKSAEALLKCGADPNIVADCTERFEYEKAILQSGELINGKRWRITGGLSLGETALYIASGYSWIDTQAKKDPKYVNLLLEYGADPNICYIGVDSFTMPGGTGYGYGGERGTSPLMESIGCGIEKTKALVEGGADINHKSETGRTAAIKALSTGSGAVVIELRRYAHYLIVEEKAIVTDPYYRSIILPGDNPDDEFCPVDILRGWVFELNTEDYRLKMEIVEEFARQGIDYWATEIPQNTLQTIKHMYPDTWEEYIQRY